jgi:hypothetical protein
MEFSIPISKFDPTCVKLGQPRTGPFRKTIPFSYQDKDNSLQLTNLLITLNPLKVIEIDNEKNQITLEEIKNCSYLSKIDQLQQVVSHELDTYPVEEPFTKFPLQPWFKSGRLTLYLSDKPELLNFYLKEGPSVFSEKTVKPGDFLRAIVKLHGLSLQMSENDIWTGKSRIQHHILQLYKLRTTD